MKIYSALHNYSKPYYVSSEAKLKIIHEKIVAKYKAKINGNDNAQFKDFTKERQQAAVLTRFFSDVKAAATGKTNEVSSRDPIAQFMDDGYWELVNNSIPQSSHLRSFLGIPSNSAEQGLRAEQDLAAIIDKTFSNVNLDNMAINLGQSAAGANNLINLTIMHKDGFVDETTKILYETLKKEYQRYKRPRSFSQWLNDQWKDGKIDVGVKEAQVTWSGTPGFNQVLDALNGATFTIKSYRSLSWYNNGEKLNTPIRRDNRLTLGATVTDRVLYIMFSSILNYNAPTAFSGTYASLNHYKNNEDIRQMIEEISLIYELTGTGLVYQDPKLQQDIKDLQGAKFMLYNDPSESYKDIQAGGVYVESCGWLLQQLLNSNLSYKYGKKYQLSRSLMNADHNDLFT